MKKTGQQGFTLIELLVVVAIIAILSGTILVALNSARAKAKGARIQAEMQQLKSQMELYYSSNSNGYGTATNDCSAGGFGAGTNNASTLITGIKADIGLPTGQSTSGTTSMTCYATGESWAVSVASTLVPNGSWCVDSNGVSKSSVATSAGSC